MLCCVGLIGGMAIGQSMGGPWTYIAPAAGFGIGLVADMKFMHRMHEHGDRRNTGMRTEKDAGPIRGIEAAERPGTAPGVATRHGLDAIADLPNRTLT